MRYKTFSRVVTLGAVGALVLGLYALCRGGGSTPEPAPEPRPAATAPSAPAAAPAATAAPAAPVAAAPPEAATDPDALRPMDREILARVAEDISGDKAKDAVPGRPWKVNLYKDSGQSAVNRLKIDLNRNEKWEEKWTLSSEGGKQVVKRQVAPADDEKYTVEYRLEGDRWRRK